MTTALSPFTSPDLLPTGTAALKTTEARIPDLDMDEIRTELFAALQDIEDLPARYPNP
jgi:hypothetical protein